MKKTRGSHRLVFKLTLLILLLSTSTAAGFYWISSHDIGRYIHTTIFPNIQQHLVYIIKDVRKNPTPAYISELADRLNMNIAITHNGHFWSTSSDLRQHNLERAQRRRRDDRGDHYEGVLHNREAFELEHIPWLLLAKKHPDLRRGKLISVDIGKNTGLIYREPHLQIALVFRKKLRPLTELNYLKYLFWLMLIMVITFLILYRMLRPLKDLREGVQAIERGNYHSPIPQKGKDELARLAQSFNHMTISVSEQIKRKEQLLFDMSHELRSPLARIKVALEFLPKSRAKTLIDNDIKEQETIIEELLEAARLKNKAMELNIQSVDINLLIEKTIAKRQLQRIQRTSPEKTLVVAIDEHRIRRVIDNLIDNALKYAPDATPITIDSTKHTGYIRVTVSDQGPGIPKVDEERIFEPFYRLDSSRTKSTGGYGLGLSLCRQILEAHKGRIYASTGKEGLIVTFTIPNTE